LILRYVIDRYATRFQEYTTAEFFRGVSLLLGAAVGVAFISRIAKNFQDYYINVITQRLGAQLYSDGIRHSLELPYAVFEDQRSGETLGKLQKVRTDVERLISTSINVLFTSLVGIVFLTLQITTSPKPAVRRRLPPSTLMHITSLAPVLSATFSRVCIWIMASFGCRLRQVLGTVRRVFETQRVNNINLGVSGDTPYKSIVRYPQYGVFLQASTDPLRQLPDSLPRPLGWRQRQPAGHELQSAADPSASTSTVAALR
jgi:ABC-type multidrug transport system fused ATPase/permease subunit